MTGNRYIVCAAHAWNQQLFEVRSSEFPGEWRLVRRRDELTKAFIDELKPRYAFFLHWSWLVPADILSSVEAVCFHMTDLPYGRGGSPLQNLIQRGHKSTMLSALRMTDVVDAGPIYMKRPLDLSGRAQEIYERASQLAFDMIKTIISEQPQPQPQAGKPTLFRRRSPAESAFPVEGDLATLFDHIRMLDADGYPRAFLDHGKYHLEFSNATFSEDGLIAQVKISRRKADD